MPRRRRQLIAAALCAALPALANAEARYLSTYVWPVQNTPVGGLSGLEVSEDGRVFTALSDRGSLYRGTFERDAGSQIVGLEAEAWLLPQLDGQALQEDSEGLAIDAAGAIHISLEGAPRIWTYADPAAVPVPRPMARDLSRLEVNRGLEALAVQPDGTFLILAEAEIGEGFPVFRLSEGRWSTLTTLPTLGPHLPVGADMGPDGAL